MQGFGIFVYCVLFSGIFLYLDYKYDTYQHSKISKKRKELDAKKLDFYYPNKK